MEEKSPVEFRLTVPDLWTLSESKMAATPWPKRPFPLRFSNFFFPFPVQEGRREGFPHLIWRFSKGGGATAQNRKCVIPGPDPGKLGVYSYVFEGAESDSGGVFKLEREAWPLGAHFRPPEGRAAPKF